MAGLPPELTVTPVGPRQYKVSSPNSVHWVALGYWDLPPCDCEDHLWRDRICKHIKAVQAYEKGKDDEYQSLKP